MNAIWLAAAMLAAAAPAPAPPQPECRPLTGPSLRAGCWGLVRVKVINNSGGPARVLLLQRNGDFAQSTVAAAELAAGQQGEYLVHFRPLSSRIPLSVEFDPLDPKAETQPIAFGEDAGPPGTAPRVLPAGVPRVVVVRSGEGAPLRGVPRADQGRMHPDHLPKLVAVYEGMDLLVISELPAGGLTPAQRTALADWFRAGGRAVVTSRKVLLSLSDELLGKLNAEEPESEAGWRELLGSGSAAHEVWESGRPVVAEFRRGFGRGLLVLPAKGAARDWSEAVWAIGSDRPAPVAPLVAARLYNRGDDIPGLGDALVGASSALRWGLIVAVAILAAGLLFWRRGKPRRFPLAVAGAGLGAALAVLLLDPAPDLRALRLQVEEHSADGAGVRAREYLYLEKVDSHGTPRAEIRAASGVLPSPILYAAEEAREISSRTSPRSAGAKDPRRLRLAFSGPSMFVGAGPLPGATPLASPPAGATRMKRIDGLGEQDAVAAIADCLADRGAPRRPQAEFLARYLWDEVAARTGEGRVTVCRLPATEPALVAEGGNCRTAGLERLGIFFGAKQ
jgi:hypothetical protein